MTGCLKFILVPRLCFIVERCVQVVLDRMCRERFRGQTLDSSEQ
jgi:hypothetical protein